MIAYEPVPEAQPAPATVLHIAHVGITRLRVQLVAATEMVFELQLGPELDYDQVITDLCGVAPAMLTYDAALMEAYDSPTTLRRLLGPRKQIGAFVDRYRPHLINISVAFPPFADLGRDHER